MGRRPVLPADLLLFTLGASEHPGGREEGLGHGWLVSGLSDDDVSIKQEKMDSDNSRQCTRDSNGTPL